MMEQKQDNADPVAKSPVTTSDAASKPTAGDPSKSSSNTAAVGKSRNTDTETSARERAILDEPDDGLPEPAHPVRNKLREYRIENMMSKAELARKAGLSVLTVARIEKGYDCRMDTKRKLLKALGLKLADRRKVFEDE